MVSVGDIYRFIDGFAPFHTAMDFDNCGLQVGSPEQEVHRALLALDLTPDVVCEASRRDAQLLISHHPVIFNPLHDLRSGTAPYLLAESGIAAICAHTNLDLAPGGVNTCLAARLKLADVRTLASDPASGLPAALVGKTEKPCQPQEFAEFVKAVLGCDGLFYTDGKRAVSSVGLCSGAGCDYLEDASSFGCQAFVTGEAKHHELIHAENIGMTLVAAGHYYTEDVVIAPLEDRLKKAFPSVEFFRAEASHCPASYL